MPAQPEVTARVPAIRDRLAALEIQRLDLLADESVPGRKRRLDALRGAQADLRAELAELDGPPRPRAGARGAP